MYVTLSDFRNLLHTLKEQSIGIKVKTQAGWSNDYLDIIGFIVSTIDQEKKTFGGVVLSNSTETEGVMVNNIASILSFQIKGSCANYEADKVYILQDSLAVKAVIV